MRFVMFYHSLVSDWNHGNAPFLRGVASALDTAHARGVIHRDVKPANILVVRDHAYLADFGLTKAVGVESITRSGPLLGTLDYVAPEQIRGEEVDSRADVYSLGAVLFECLTGSVPFKRSTDVAVLYVGDEAEKQALLKGEPDKFFTAAGYDGWPLIMLRLDEVDAKRLEELIKDAWQMRSGR